MPMKAPSLPQLYKLAKSKGLTITQSIFNNQDSIIHITISKEYRGLAMFRNTKDITKLELFRGIKGFLDAL